MHGRAEACQCDHSGDENGPARSHLTQFRHYFADQEQRNKELQLKPVRQLGTGGRTNGERREPGHPEHDRAAQVVGMPTAPIRLLPYRSTPTTNEGSISRYPPTSRHHNGVPRQ